MLIWVIKVLKGKKEETLTAAFWHSITIKVQTVTINCSIQVSFKSEPFKDKMPMQFSQTKFLKM